MPIDSSIGTRLAAVPEITSTTQRDAAGAELDVVCQLAMDAARALVAEAGNLGDRVQALEDAPGGGAVGRTLTAVFDGGAVDGTPESVRVGTVVELRTPYALTLTGWTLLLNAATGSVTVEVRTKPFASGSFASITGSAPPSTTGGANATDAVTGWTTSIDAGHLVQFEITARTGLVPRVTLQLQATQA
jgi:hypothetical protein